jgi:hypothetical protein
MGSGVLRLFWKFWRMRAAEFWLQFCFENILFVLTLLFPSDCILIRWCRIVAYKVLGVSGDFVCADLKKFRTISCRFSVRCQTSFRQIGLDQCYFEFTEGDVTWHFAGAPVVVHNIWSFWQWTFGRAQRILRIFALGRRCSIFSISN